MLILRLEDYESNLPSHLSAVLAFLALPRPPPQAWRRMLSAKRANRRAPGGERMLVGSARGRVETATRARAPARTKHAPNRYYRYSGLPFAAQRARPHPLCLIALRACVCRQDGTASMLRAFYRPFNEDLVRLLNEPRYLRWHAEPSLGEL